jgi:Tfp pilus assembly protein FimT
MTKHCLRGFTLAEILIVMVISLLLTILMLEFLSIINKSINMTQDKSDDQEINLKWYAQFKDDFSRSIHITSQDNHSINLINKNLSKSKYVFSDSIIYKHINQRTDSIIVQNLTFKVIDSIKINDTMYLLDNVSIEYYLKNQRVVLSLTKIYPTSSLINNIDLNE